MAQISYSTHALVLKKTKLGESDLIVTFLSVNGGQIRAVAKGARKPSSSFASRLELFSEVDVLLASGKNLDIVKEVRLCAAYESLRASLELNACASVFAELLYKLTEHGSDNGADNARFFEMSAACFSAMDGATPNEALSLCVAACVKAFAFMGIGAHYVHCVSCGQGIGTSESAWFSCEDGGALCARCHSAFEAVSISAATLQAMEFYLRTSFAAIAVTSISVTQNFDCLRLVQEWCRYHVGYNLKSLSFLFNCGLF